MAMTEEDRPLMQRLRSPGAANASPGARNALKPLPFSLKGFLTTFFAVLLLFLLAAMASRVIKWASDSEDSLTADTVESSLGGAEGAHLSGLVNPNNGSHPTLTTTADCTGDTHFPVLAGVDVVAYWALPEGSKPVFGTPNLVALFGDYRFYFSSIENLRTFESDPLKYIPAWGGFCSYGVAAEKFWTADILGPFGDPSKWLILPGDGRLHVFRSELPMSKFLLTPAEYLEAGDASWNGWFPAAEKGGPAPLNTACLCSEEMCVDG
ncbi:unnamed protein product [Ectocarpus fasciculatus]